MGREICFEFLKPPMEIELNLLMESYQEIKENKLIC